MDRVRDDPPSRAGRLLPTADERAKGDYCSIAEAAVLLGVSRASIWRWIREGRLPAARLGHRTIRIRRDDLVRTLSQASPGRPISDEPRVEIGDGDGDGRVPTRDWADADAHVVQFYETDPFLLDAVADFLHRALQGGDAGIVIATEVHRAGIEERLRANGLDLDTARADGRYLSLNAAETLLQVMSDGQPQPARFVDLVGDAITRTAAAGRRVRVYGEMVALLMEQGDPTGALALEQRWNELQVTRSFSLLCGYPMGSFSGEALAELFGRVCAEHVGVVPAESYAALTQGDDQRRAIVLLQQKAASLEAEIAERRRAEQERLRAETELRDFLDHAAVGLHWVSPDGRILWANQAELDLLGYTAEEYVGHRIAEFHVDEDVIRDILARLARKETLENYEARMRCKDASIRHVLISSNVLWDGDSFVHTRCVTVDITARKLAEQRLAVQYAVTRTLAESETLAEAATPILQCVCETLGWEAGGIWSVHREAGVLRCDQFWHSLSVDVGEFEVISRQTALPRGIGLPGRVWASGEPAWIPDALQDHNFLRAPHAARAGLHAAFAFPIRLGDEVLGVVEFFSREMRLPDRDLLAMMSAVGGQIGQFMERVHAEEALRVRERRYRRIFETAAVSIWEEDFSATVALLEQLKADGVADLGAWLDAHPDTLRRAVQMVRVVDVNERTLQLFEAGNKEELLASLGTIFVGETLPVFRDELIAIFEGQRTFASEAQLRTVRGERRDVVFTVALPEPGGAYESVLVTLIDVTEQRRAETEARRLRLDLYALLMQSPVPIAVVAGPELVFELANPPYIEVTGGREVVGKPVLEAFPELVGQGYDDFLRNVMRTGEPIVREESLLRLERQGTLQDTYWTFIYAPLRNSEGVVDRVMAICSEVTQQVRARQEIEAYARRLADSEERLRLALEAGNTGTWDWDPATGQVVWSKETEMLFGLEPGAFDSTYETYLHLIHPDDRAGMAATIADAAWRGGDFAAEHRAIRPDGAVRWLACRGRAYRDEAGRMERVVGTVTDVTERREADEERQRLERERDAFLAAVSHDLKNPLATIKGTTQLLRRWIARSQGIDPERLAAGLGTVESTSNQMLGLIEELLDTARLRLGQQLLLDPRATDLVLLARRVVAAQQAATDRHNLRVEATVDRLVGEWDAARIERVLGNLLANAVKYSPAGGEIRVELAREDRPDGHWAVVRVRDWGVGIAAGDLDRIFDPFQRGANVADIGGTGLGLAAVRQIVAQHGGSVGAQSELGLGSTFTVRLPLEAGAR